MLPKLVNILAPVTILLIIRLGDVYFFVQMELLHNRLIEPVLNTAQKTIMHIQEQTNVFKIVLIGVFTLIIPHGDVLHNVQPIQTIMLIMRLELA